MISSRPPPVHLSKVISDIIIHKKKILNPIFQIVQIRIMKNHNALKYKIIISDGVHFVSAFGVNILSNKIQQEMLKQHSIVCLTDYNLFPQYNETILIINDMQFIRYHDTFIGDPQDIKNSLNNSPKQHIQFSQQPQAQLPIPTNVQPLSSMPNQSENSLSILSPVSAIIVTSVNPSTSQPPLIEPSTKKALYHQIKDLSPYIHAWTILARVVFKSNEHPYRKNDGQMSKYFSVLLKDNTGEIRGVFFDQQCESFYTSIEYEKVYKISGGYLKDNLYRKTDHEYEIIFNHKTRFEKMRNEPTISVFPSFKFCKLSDLPKMEISSNCYVDILGYIIKNSAVPRNSPQNSQNCSLRLLQICDNSGVKCEIELWDDLANDFPSDENVVVAFKNIQVVDRRGRILKSPEQYYFDPDIPERDQLLSWLTHINPNSFQSITNPKNENRGLIFLSKINEFGQLNTTNIATSMISCAHIQNINIFSRCPKRECNSNRLDHKNQCSICKTTYPKPNYRYAIDIKAQDFTGSTQMSFFGDDEGALLTDMTPEEWVNRKSQNHYCDDTTLLRSHFFDMFKVKLTIANRKDFGRNPIKCVISEIERLDFAKEACFFANEIRKYG